MSTALLPARQGIPFRADRDAVRRAGLNTLVRSAAAHVMACDRPGKPGESVYDVVAREWPDDRNVIWMTRAAVSPTSMDNTPALVQTVVSDFHAVLSRRFAAPALFALGLQLSFDDAGKISIPAFIPDPTGAGFIGEGKPFPVRQALAKPTILEPFKLGSISAFSNEMLNGSSANTLVIVENLMTQNVGLTLDTVALSADPSVADVQPAGLRYNILPLTASAETSPIAAMTNDVAAVIGAVSAVSGNTPPVLIANPARAATLRLYGGAGIGAMTILASPAIAPADLIAVAPDAIASATGSTPQMSASRDSVLHYEDGTPVNIGDLSGVAAPSQSIFQTDCVALRVKLPASWARRDDAAVSWLTAANW
ncbi:hypothetical protein IVB34_34460 [Bradyrhizobium sp. 2]|uniref:phage major capsid protein n=1 Tax=unclassified Bradyrhizobium TaxID=2631580 RepID=UPI001FFB9CE5|nr:MULTISPECIES: phage major capsid protein [unclassified Bradyrhizobium]MCK1447756.1 hypothetical protein [Bradyrhizobium sp. 48]MCK1463325.1 hypothetical protein [Bradyrhizobium sp. 2]